MISEWADELSQLEPFRTGSTQAARRPVVKAFLQQREPLAVTTDMIARLEQAANRLRRG
jgi:hypothetical protein